MREWGERIGSVTSALVWLTVLVFVAQWLWKLSGSSLLEDVLALNGTRLFHGFVWQPLTYMFLHDTGTLWHILFNMLMLWFFGHEVEFFLGPRCFTRLYLMGGVVGALLWLAFNFHAPTHLLGASAAVLTCVVAFATLFPNREITLLIFFILPVTLKAKHLALIALAIDVVPLLARTETHIAHLAHLGGMLVGYLYIKKLGYGAMPRWWLSIRMPRRKRPVSSPDEFMREQVDPLLDKIARDGMHSLTRRERKILESAKDLMQKRQR